MVYRKGNKFIVIKHVISVRLDANFSDSKVIVYTMDGRNTNFDSSDAYSAKETFKEIENKIEKFYNKDKVCMKI